MGSAPNVAATAFVAASSEISPTTVISMGADSAAAAIKQVLAMGADEGVLLNDPAFEDGDEHLDEVAVRGAAQGRIAEVGEEPAVRHLVEEHPVAPGEGGDLLSG